MAWRIASRSCGVAPRVLSARTTSASWGEAGTCMTLPASAWMEMSLFCATTVCPRDSGLGWLMTGVLLMTIERLPCAMAHGPRVTAWLSTIEPVRALMTTLAAGVDSGSCSSSSSAMKFTRAPGSMGARTCTVRPSSAVAASWPTRALIASATLRAVWKSVAARFSVMVSPPCSGVGTLRSTCAPSGMRPALRWFTCTLEPPAEAPAPPTTRLPCASA